MSAVTFLLYPDAREKDESFEALNGRLRALCDQHESHVAPLVRYGHVVPWPVFWGTKAEAIDPATLLGAVARVDWAYPVLVVYRAENENRWSHSLMGLGYETVVPS